MPYEVHVAENAPSERLVVSVGGKTLVYGEPLDEDRAAAEAGELTIVGAGEPVETEDTDLVADLAIVAELVPEVAERVDVRTIEAPVEEVPVVEEEVITHPADPADSVVGAGETTPDLERVDAETGETVDAPQENDNGDAGDA